MWIQTQFYYYILARKMIMNGFHFCPKFKITIGKVFCKIRWHFQVQSNTEVYLSFASIYINPDYMKHW